jgi:hypothetical protein
MRLARRLRRNGPLALVEYENSTIKMIVLAALLLPATEEVKARRVPRRTTYGRPVRALSPAQPGRAAG